MQVEAPTSVLQCHTVYGALRGLETLSQLIDRVPVDDTRHMDLQQSPTAAGDPFSTDLSPWQAIIQMLSNCWSSFTQLLGHHDKSQSNDSVIEAQDAEDHHLSLAGNLEGDDFISSFIGQSTDTLTVGDAADVVDYVISDQDSYFDIVNDIPDHMGGAVAALQQRSHHAKHRHSKDHNKRHKKHKQKKHKKTKIQYVVNATAISDAPRFKHRGLLLDTSRHFLPVQNIKVQAHSITLCHWHRHTVCHEGIGSFYSYAMSGARQKM